MKQYALSRVSGLSVRIHVSVTEPSSPWQEEANTGYCTQYIETLSLMVAAWLDGSLSQLGLAKALSSSISLYSFNMVAADCLLCK